MNKKGEGIELLGGRVVQIIEAVLVILILVAFAVAIFNFADVKPRQAKGLVDNIAMKINYMNANGVAEDKSFVLSYPDGWYIKSFSNDGKSQLCICDSGDCTGTINKTTFCEGFLFKVSVDQTVTGGPTGNPLSPSTSTISHSDVFKISKYGDKYYILVIKRDVSGAFILSTTTAPDVPAKT